MVLPRSWVYALDGPPNLTCLEITDQHLLDGVRRTHNPTVERGEATRRGGIRIADLGHPGVLRPGRGLPAQRRDGVGAGGCSGRLPCGPRPGAFVSFS